jgi:hypothetical protein
VTVLPGHACAAFQSGARCRDSSRHQTPPGLDDERSWVALTEANHFLWPGPDLRPARPGDAASVGYGQLPYALFEEIRTKFIAAIKARRTGVVPRSE